jgi:hypothetical protein
VTRIRTIKPTFWTSQTLGRVSRDARLVFAGLFNEADDEGRMADAPKRLAGAVCPFDEDVTAEWMSKRLDELASVGAIVRYEVDGARFIAIPQFTAHQVINRATKSLIPAPPEDSRSPHGVLTECSVGEWKGMEGNGREGKEPAAAGGESDPKPSKRAGVLANRAKTLYGSEEAARAPSTPQAVLEDHHYGKILREKFPALDGNGPRPSLIGEVTADFRSFQNKYRDHGRDAAYNGLIGWIAKRYGAHEASMRRQGGDAGLNVAAIVGGNRKQSDA